MVLIFTKFLHEFGSYLVFLKSMFTKPENAKMYWKEFMHQCMEIVNGALLIVVIISFFLGAVMTIQTAYQLVSPLIPLTTISMIVRNTLMLELSPTVICIVLAGVVGSKIASELGNMSVSEQIDALEIMGLNPRNYLVLPKLLACLLVIPMLVVISCVVGIWGGRVVGDMMGIVPGNIYDLGLRSSLEIFDVVFMVLKAFSFAFEIASISAFFGYRVKGGSFEIGRASTTSVVVACVLILILDYVISAMML
ncbi:MAG: ABC transporter permease [Chitinophagaceae bacterium]